MLRPIGLALRVLMLRPIGLALRGPTVEARSWTESRLKISFHF
jgi:hypothetical protein